jgi:hypothetical protein
MASSRRSLFPGILLIVLGILFLLPNFIELRTRQLWPAFILAPGLAFFFMYSRERSNYGLLMPAAILTMIGAMFFSITFGIASMRTLWPLFIMAPGIGFLLMYLLGKREKGLLIPAGILNALGLIFLLGVSDYDYLWPVILILIGLMFLLSGKR